VGAQEHLAPQIFGLDRRLGVKLATILDELAQAIAETPLAWARSDGGACFLELLATATHMSAGEVKEESRQLGRAGPHPRIKGHKPKLITNAADVYKISGKQRAPSSVRW
jgi:hypothetical protein